MTSTRNNLRVVQPICHTSTYGLTSVHHYGAKVRKDLNDEIRYKIKFYLTTV